MLPIIKAIILGIVEGLTEFLPISSTGHLILVNEFVKIGDKAFSHTFEIFIQFGAIFAVILYFRNRIIPGFGQKARKKNRYIFEIWKRILVGIIPGLILGVLFASKIQDALYTAGVVALTLLIGGVFLLYIEGRKRKYRYKSIMDINYQTAFYIGACQCLAMIPGTSRSAATIIGAMLLGVSRMAAAEYSFYLAIPSLFGASCFSLLKPIMKHEFSITPAQWTLLAIGFIVSFLVAWVVIAAFMKFISRHDFKPFGWYRIVIGILVLVYFGINGQLWVVR